MRTLLKSLAALALCAGCGQRSDRLPDPPVDQFHYPALMAAVGRDGADPVLVVDSTNLDGLYAYGTVLAAPTDPSLSFLGGELVTSYTTELRVLQDAPAVLTGFELQTASACRLAGPTLFLGARDHLYRMDLVNGVPVCGGGCVKDFSPRFSRDAWPLGVSCPPESSGRPRRVWVGFLRGVNDVGYVGQLTLDGTGIDGQYHDLDDLVEVYAGNGFPLAFAYDPTWDRLYFVTQEFQESAYLRWIDPGESGCQPFLLNDGIQDESQGGCHVDSGIDLSQWLRGAEGVDIRLSGRPPGACETPVDPGVLCRRAYVGIRVYDADLAAVIGTRPLEDLGGQLWVLEIPQTTTRTEPRLLGRFDVGNGVTRLQVIPRPGRPDLVAAVARVDDQLWIYDDELGAMAGGVGRNGNGVPLLGHDLIGLAAVQKDAATARLYVSASSDQWVSAVEVSLDPVANTVPVCVVLRDPDTGVETCTPPEQVSLGAHVMHIKGVHP